MPGRDLEHRLTTTVAIALLAGASEATIAAPIVDQASPASVAALSREDLEKLPVGRRVEDLIKTCPAQTIPTIASRPGILIDGRPTSTGLEIDCLRPTDLDMIEVYRTHNSVRAEYGAGPLVWDSGLVQSASRYAGQLGQTGTLVHASREGRGIERENLSQGLPGWSTQQLMGSWLKEKQNFVPGVFPNVSRTGDWYQVGHWTQMIWAATTLIGCAKASGIGSSWLVCRYSPGGNKDGKTVGLPPAQIASSTDANTTIRPRLVGGGYGKVVQPDLSGKGEAFRPNTARPQQAETKYEPSNPNQCDGVTYFDAAKLYEDAKAKGDRGGMLTAKAQMTTAIANQRRWAEDANEAGEMARVGPHFVVDLLDKMMTHYERLTGEHAPGKYDPPTGFELADGVCKPVDTAVQQPNLGSKEAFKPDPPPKLDDPM